MKPSAPSAPEAPLARLLESPEPLAADAALSLAAARLRDGALPALPVVADSRLLGLISDRAVLAALLGGGSGPCREWAVPATAVPVTTPLQDVLWMLRRDDVEVLVVLSREGDYLGVVSRRRVLQALEDGRKPRLVGGLATPLGVHLTDVHHRGGVPDLALIFSGFYLVLLFQVARLLVTAAIGLTAADPMRVALAEYGGALVASGAVPPPALWTQFAVAALFLTLLRISPLAGYHAGEHQTVHALERGVPLEWERVRELPRPHPRCGTNLAVLLGLVGLLIDLAASRADSVWLLLPLVGLLFWRRIGLWIQAVFTTRPASRRQVEAGIQAARMLLMRYQRQPEQRARLWLRIWNRGLVQVLLGFGLGLWVSERAAWLFGWLVRYA